MKSALEVSADLECFVLSYRELFEETDTVVQGLRKFLQLGDTTPLPDTAQIAYLSLSLFNQ